MSVYSETDGTPNQTMQLTSSRTAFAFIKASVSSFHSLSEGVADLFLVRRLASMSDTPSGKADTIIKGITALATVGTLAFAVLKYGDTIKRESQKPLLEKQLTTIF
jgi:hypothetical protein